MPYIDVDKAIEVVKGLKGNCDHRFYDEALTDVQSELLAIPTEDVAEVKYGEWFTVSHYRDCAYGTCSACAVRGRLRTEKDDDGVWFINTPRCPNCGAIMRLGGKS